MLEKSNRTFILVTQQLHRIREAEYVSLTADNTRTFTPECNNIIFFLLVNCYKRWSRGSLWQLCGNWIDASANNRQMELNYCNGQGKKG